jgi:hypothetical protein
MIKFFWESIKLGMSLWYGWIAAFTTVGGILIWLISKVFPNIPAPIYAYKIVAGILLLSFVAGIAVGTYKVYQKRNVELESALIKVADLEKKLEATRPSGFSTPDQLISKYLDGLDFRIVDLARNSVVIKNRTIQNCRIYGPAVLLLKTGSISHCIFDADPTKSAEETVNGIYIPLLKSDVIYGVIAVENVDFKNCEFHGIAFMGPDELRDMLITSLGQK